MERKRSPFRSAALLLVIAALAFPLLFMSCGSDEYQKPSTTQTPTALISAGTLKAWIDAGKVNGTGYDRVVILDITAQPDYDYGHIPGAHFVNSADTYQTRSEGIAMLSTEVLEGSKMDALVQKYGIDGNTTIVFTGKPASGPGPGFIARVYFMFRYWGFPKNRLKVLDGGNFGWTEAGYSLTSLAQQLPAPTTFSVRNHLRLRDDLRLSLPEMIAYADGRVPNALAIDARGASGSSSGVGGQTAGVFNPSSDFVVFEGRIRGSAALAFSGTYNSGNYKFLSADRLIAQLTAKGANSAKTSYIYCRIGVQGAVLFFVLDGILDWPVAFYDASWSQWGQLSGDATKKGQLASDSPWRTDIPSRSENISYNFDTFKAFGPAGFVGTGLNDATSGGVFTGAADRSFLIEIDSAGTPDTFKWSSNGGTAWTATNVAITGAVQTLVDGMTITFGATTGHTSWSISPAAFAGAGLNDAISGGVFTGATDRSFVIEITESGTTDTFRWSRNGGYSWTSPDGATGVAITGAAQTLADGVTVTFGATTGHAVGDRWTFSASVGDRWSFPATVNPKAVEQYTADGSVCSARYNMDGTIFNSASGATACTNLPDSYETNANRIEEADKAYMRSGGRSGGGSSGGGGTIPGGC